MPPQGCEYNSFVRVDSKMSMSRSFRLGNLDHNAVSSGPNEEYKLSDVECDSDGIGKASLDDPISHIGPAIGGADPVKVVQEQALIWSSLWSSKYRPLTSPAAEYIPGIGGSRVIDTHNSVNVHTHLLGQHACAACSKIYRNHAEWHQHHDTVHKQEGPCPCPVTRCPHHCLSLEKYLLASSPSHSKSLEFLISLRTAHTGQPNTIVNAPLSQAKHWLVVLYGVNKSDDTYFLVHFLNDAPHEPRYLVSKIIQTSTSGKHGIPLLQSMLENSPGMPRHGQCSTQIDTTQSTLLHRTTGEYAPPLFPLRPAATIITIPSAAQSPRSRPAGRPASDTRQSLLANTASSVNKPHARKKNDNKSRSTKRRKLDDDDDGVDESDDSDREPDPANDSNKSFPCVYFRRDAMGHCLCEKRFSNFAALVRHLKDVHRIIVCSSCLHHFVPMDELEQFTAKELLRQAKKMLKQHRKPRNARSKAGCPNPVCLKVECKNWSRAVCRCAAETAPWEKYCILYESLLVGRQLPAYCFQKRTEERLATRSEDGMDNWPTTTYPEDGTVRSWRQGLLQAVDDWQSQRNPSETGEDVPEAADDPQVGPSTAALTLPAILRRRRTPSTTIREPLDPVAPPPQQYIQPALISHQTSSWVHPNEPIPDGTDFANLHPLHPMASESSDTRDISVNSSNFQHAFTQPTSVEGSVHRTPQSAQLNTEALYGMFKAMQEQFQGRVFQELRAIRMDLDAVRTTTANLSNTTEALQSRVSGLSQADNNSGGSSFDFGKWCEDYQQGQGA